ncbi:hypothetical protein HGB24_01925 [Candidatus Saccharibacteria bacterium]|nr:hypothetical protein [Candidatus Saccharibacteria bacterium]
MKYFYSDQPLKQAAIHVANSIERYLIDGQKVLWLLSGGSSIPIAVMASELLKGVDLKNLSVTLTDERYGPIGHPDENYQQLLSSGLDLPGADIYRPMIGKDEKSTVETFIEWLDTKLKTADYKISLFGLGSDGHTCGIKPNSPAVSSSDLATIFDGDDFTRLTITFSVIRQINEAIIQASGDIKISIIKDLFNQDLPLSAQPAQILKSISNATLYTDINKEEIK